MTTVIPVDDYSPIFVGDTSNPFSIYVAHKNGFMSILGTTITMKLFNTATNTIKTCTGPWTIDSRDNGKASYVYQSVDVDTVGVSSQKSRVGEAGRVNQVKEKGGFGQPAV